MLSGQAVEKKYRCVIQHEEAMLYCFHTENLPDAIAKIVVLITDEYPRAHGKIVDRKGRILFKCRQQAVC